MMQLEDQARASARCVGKFQAMHLLIVSPRGGFPHAVVGPRGMCGACTGLMAIYKATAPFRVVETSTLDQDRYLHAGVFAIADHESGLQSG